MNESTPAMLSTDPASITKALNSPTPVSGDDNSEQPSCPPPLAWADVLHEFRETSEVIEVSVQQTTATARVWGTGQPLYFLNGICGDSELFCLLGYLIKEDFRCVIIDYPDLAPNIDAYIDVLFAVADQLGDPAFDLFATSFGSAIGIEAALRQSDRIKRLVLQGPLGDFKLSLFEWLAAIALRWLPCRLSRLPLRRRIHAATHRLWFPPLDETRWSFYADNSGRSKVSQVARRALWLNRTRSKFEELSMPLLLVSCEGESPRYVRAATEMASKIPGAQHEQLSNAGHVPYITHPHRLANLLRPFLADSVS
jgi:pimeloyl-ACP methyl ester carboxylesterase